MYSDMDSLKYSMSVLMDVLKETEEYISKGIAGEIKPTEEESRKVFNAVMSTPVLEEEEFKKLFLEKMRDFAVVSHLSDLAKREVELAEKMNALLASRSSQ